MEVWKFVVLSYWIELALESEWFSAFVFADLKSESTNKAIEKVGFWLFWCNVQNTTELLFVVVASFVVTLKVYWC